jgi:glycosyltransferase involved in cell wall biosynthesis
MNYDCMAEQSNKIRGSVLMVTTNIYKNPTGGRGLLSKLNADALRTLYGNHLHIYELQRSPLRGIVSYYNAFRGFVDGLNAATIDEICAIVRRRNVRHVFVDGSNLGALVDVLKHRFNCLVITVFFHNVEARFFWGNFIASKSIRALAILVANCLAECKATCLSDKRICLSERDSNLLKRIYGKNATHIAPMAMEDKLPSFGDDGEPPPDCKPFALFVGGNFYANRDGIIWFVQHVAQLVDIKTYVVGKGMEDMRAQLEIPGRVDVIGSVDSLAEWYRRARFVIAPIFDGSGMKTKVAEALMHGKKVVGTPEAFSGYEKVAARAGWCCSSPTEFVAAINAACSTITLSFDPELRLLYEEYFSFSAATARLAFALGEAEILERGNPTCSEI